MSEPNLIDAARRQAKELGADAVIIIVFKSDTFESACYGTDEMNRVRFTDVCNRIHDDIAHGAIPILDKP